MVGLKTGYPAGRMCNHARNMNELLGILRRFTKGKLLAWKSATHTHFLVSVPSEIQLCLRKMEHIISVFKAIFHPAAFSSFLTFLPFRILPRLPDVCSSGTVWQEDPAVVCVSLEMCWTECSTLKKAAAGMFTRLRLVSRPGCFQGLAPQNN